MQTAKCFARRNRMKDNENKDDEKHKEPEMTTENGIGQVSGSAGQP